MTNEPNNRKITFSNPNDDTWMTREELDIFNSAADKLYMQHYETLIELYNLEVIDSLVDLDPDYQLANDMLGEIFQKKA